MAGKLPGRAISNTATITVAAITVGNAVINSSIIALGNSTVNTYVNSSSVSTVVLNVGSNVFVNTSTIHLGNSTVNTVIHTTGFTGNGAGLHSVNAAALEGNTVANILTSANTAANTLANAAYSNAVSYAASNTYVNNTFLPLAGGTLTGAITVGNSTVNSVVNSTAASLGNTTINGFVNVSSNLTVTSVAAFGNNVTITGNLIVTGTRIFANTTTVDLSDNIITLNADIGQVTPSENAGLEVHRGTSANVQFVWNETIDKWTFTTDGTTYVTVASNNDVTTAYSNAIAYSGNAALAYANAIAYSGNAALAFANAASRADSAYSNAIAIAANGSNITSGTVAFARLPALYIGTTQIQSTSAAQAVSGITTLAAGNTTITGFINVSTNTATFGTAVNIVANGNVGIGSAANTSQRLYVSVSTTDSVNGAANDASSYPVSRFMAHSSGGGVRGLEIGAPTGGVASPVYIKVAETSVRFAILNNSGTEQFTILNDGKVGIGDSSPSTRFRVSGGRSVFAANSEFYSIAVQHNSGSVGQFYIGATNDVNPDMLFSNTGGSEIVRFAANGNVGIGTTNPLQKFVVSNGGALGFEFVPATGILQLYNRSTSAYGDFTFDAANFIWRPSGTEAMRLNSSGNVGIGTASPVTKLNIASAAGSPTGVSVGAIRIYETTNNYGLNIGGDGTYGYIQGVRGATSSIGYNDLVLQPNGGNLGIGTASPGVRADISGVMRSSTWSLSGTGVTGGTTAFSAGTVSTDTNWGMYFRAGTSSSAVAEYSFRNAADTERMRIDSSGNVGIGNASPWRRLDITGGGIAFTDSGGASRSLHWGDRDTGIFPVIVTGDSRSGYGTLSLCTAAFGNSASARIIIDSVGRTMFNTSTANTTANTVMTVKSFTSNTGNFSFEFRDSADTLRSTITDRGAQNWYIMAADGIEKGSIRYSTPGGSIGILYFDSAGASRSDFRHVANGGFTWHAHTLSTVPPELMRMDNAGNLTIVGTLTESSSITQKENLDPIQDALGAVTSLTGYVYDRKDGTAKRRAGLIAEEVETILPNVVKKDNDGNPTGIQYTNLIAYLVESIKELKAEIDLLKGK